MDHAEWLAPDTYSLIACRPEIGVWTRLVRLTSRDWVLGTGTTSDPTRYLGRYHSLQLIDKKKHGGEGGDFNPAIFCFANDTSKKPILAKEDATDALFTR